MEPIDLDEFSYVPTGSVDHEQIQTNFDELQKKLNEVIDEMNRRDELLSTYTRSMLVEPKNGEYEIEFLKFKDHHHCKIQEAWITVVGKLKREQIIRLVTKDKDIVDPITINDTVSMGAAYSMSFNPYHIINRFDTVDIIATSQRKVIVTLVLEEV